MTTNGNTADGNVMKDKADIPATKTSEEISLLGAVERNDEALVKTLLSNGADLYACDESNNPPLYNAVALRHHQLLPLFIAAYTDQEISPLSKAIILRDESRALELIAGGALVDAVDCHGDQPVHWACRLGLERVVDKLLERKVPVESGGRFDKTPLILAAQYGHKNISRALLDAGAKPNVWDVQHSTPLHWAAQRGYADLVQELLNAGASMEAQCEKGWTPLKWAVLHDHAEVVRLFLAAGANVDKRNDFKRTLLHYAALRGSAEVMRVLMAAGADVNARNEIKRTPLHHAAEGGQAEAVRVLLAAGAAVDEKDDSGDTPLYAAVCFDHTEVVQVLLAAGATVDGQGMELLHRAAWGGHAGVMQVLLAAGQYL